MFLGSVTLGAAAFTTRGLFADELVRTPRQTEGPFYPDKLPLDTDNDLLVINDAITPAVGEVTHLTGRILDAGGNPLKNALVEIWQVDNNGAYIHSRDPHRGQHDTNFQGFGRFLTGSTGEYYFRTIKPVPYTGRTSHIHFKVLRAGKELLTTQCYVKGEPRNEKDGIYRGIRDPKGRAAVTVDFSPLPGSQIGELAAKFDIVLGLTPSG
jgi:protocatechuate 3,4-dioxygenase beta subunit